MNNNFEAVIGIEIHLELNTKSKMFSPSKNPTGDEEPNSCINEIDLGYPGTLPMLNKEAVIKAIKLAKALKMNISREIVFDRKNYFYPDLPKGYQITQYYTPIATDGKLELIMSDQKTKMVRIREIHMEEDTAKTIRKDNKLFLDFNRAGVPLIEIVTEPDLSSPLEAKNYVNSIREIAKILDISDARLERGSLRADLNVSVREKGDNKLHARTEIKNLNSLKNIEKALTYEIAFQIKQILNGEKIENLTKKFDENIEKTVTMRKKTTEIDYRYFTEPNIPKIFLSEEDINKVNIPPLPFKLRKQYQEMGILDEHIKMLIGDSQLRNFFHSICYHDKKRLANIVFINLLSVAKKVNQKIYELSIMPEEIAFLIQTCDQGKIPLNKISEIFLEAILNKCSLKSIIKKMNFGDRLTLEQTEKIALEVFEMNRKFIKENIANRKERVFKFLVGQVMKNSRGKANPKDAAKILNQLMQSLEKQLLN